MADPLFYRQRNSRHWDALSPNEQQRQLLKVERDVTNAQRTLKRNKPSQVVPLGSGFSYLWEVLP